jgi:hypothetical protein
MFGIGMGGWHSQWIVPGYKEEKPMCQPLGSVWQVVPFPGLAGGRPVLVPPAGAGLGPPIPSST